MSAIEAPPFISSEMSQAQRQSCLLLRGEHFITGNDCAEAYKRLHVPRINLRSELTMAKKTKGVAKKRVRRSWTKDDHRDLKAHSKSKTPVAEISKAMKRTVGALRQQALKLGISLGHRR